MDEVDVEETPEENPENPATACERFCVKKLVQANELSRFETAEAWRIWDEVREKLTPALERRWHMDTVLAMHTLLRANLVALSSSDRTDEALKRLRQLYEHAILTAEQHVDELYVLRTKRAYAAVLAYHGRPQEARQLLMQIIETLPKQEQEDQVQEEQPQDQDLWLQTTLQLADANWQLGDVDEAFHLINQIRYPEQLTMYHVAARILHARLCWHSHKGQTLRLRRMYRRLAGQMARQAAQDMYQVVSYCHSSSVKRARRLRVPLVGIWLYKRAYAKLICPLL